MSILPETLVCPQCKQRLEQNKEHMLCDLCQLAYPIRDGIPVLLIEQANTPREQ